MRILGFWALLLLASCSHVDKQVAPARLPQVGGAASPAPMDTRFGKVEMDWAEDLFTLKWDGLIVYQEQVVLRDNPKRAQMGKVGAEDYVLLESYRGDGCPTTMVLITMGDYRNYQVHQFGNCEQPKVSSNSSRIEFEFPAFPEANRKAVRWRYENGQMERLK